MREGWTKVRLDDAVVVNPAVDLPRGTEAAYIGMADVTEHVPTVSSDQTKIYKSGARFRVGDTLLARITPCLENGKTARVESLGGHDVGHGSTEFIVLRARAGATLPGFVTLLATSPRLRHHAIRHMVGTSGRQRVSGQDIGNFEIDLPPIDVQRRIVDLIEHVDVAVLRSERCEERADNLRRPLTAALTRGEPCRPVGELVATARAGGTPTRSRPDFFGGGIAWVKSGEVAGPDITTTAETITERGLEESSARLMRPGATLVAMYGATAGQVGRLRTEAATNQAVLALTASESIESDYLYVALRAASKEMSRRATGAAQPNLSKARVLETLIPVPPISRQRVVSAVALAVREAAARAKQTGNELRALRSAILTSLLSGAHEIPESYDRFLDDVEMEVA